MLEWKCDYGSLKNDDVFCLGCVIIVKLLV